jgi:DNA-binding IclR family transcriptional regulator
MAEHTFESLKKHTVAELREIAKEIDHEAVKGATQMNKEHLVEAICTALGIDRHQHHQVVGLDKASVKGQIKTLKAERDSAIEAKDHARLKMVRRRMHRLKRLLHKATV